MTVLTRHRVGWTGFPGGPGVSTFYGLGDGAAMTTFLHTFFLALASYIPNDVTIQVESSGDLIEDTTGELTGTWTADAADSINCLSSAVYAAPAGLGVTWTTDTVLDGHRLRGRTFIVPLEASAYQTDGTLDGTVRGAFIAAAETFVAGAVGDFVIWHRPRIAAAATPYHPAVTARAGGHGLVTASSVRDKAVVLRSRRD